MTWRRAAPRGTIEAGFAILGTEPDPTDALTLTARSVGGQAITVGNAGFILPDERQLFPFVRKPPGWPKPLFPQTLESGRRQVWFAPLEEMKATLRRQGIPSAELRPWIDLESGQRILGEPVRLDATEQ